MRPRSMKVLLVVGAVVAGVLPLHAASAAPVKHTSATGTNGAVVTDTVPSTQAALAILHNGGTAADAAVAAAAVLGVTDPFAAGIGGGGIFVYYDAATKKVFTIDGEATAPR